MKPCTPYPVVPLRAHPWTRFDIRAMGSLVVILALVAAFGAFFPSTRASAEDGKGNSALVRVEIRGRVEDLGLPVYGHLRDGAGNEYALVITSTPRLAAKSLSYRTLDAHAEPGAYLLALERRRGARALAARQLSPIMDDGRQILVRNGPGVAEKLGEMGFDVKVLPASPITPGTWASAVRRAVVYDVRVAAMMNQVTESSLYDEVGRLSGETPIDSGGSPYTITTRHTGSSPLTVAGQYVYRSMEEAGLKVSYYPWSVYGSSGSNIIGSITGSTKPEEIVLITAHLDDMPSSGAAPGADDNASGSVGLLTAARIMAQYPFERTVRFVFFTGEEQGLLGSASYANAVSSAGENIVAVYNMDMIAYESQSTPVLRLKTRLASDAGSAADTAIATLFTDVVTAYGLSPGLTPVITHDGDYASDHSPFWDRGYAAILAIEDDLDDFNPYYHTADDRRALLNMAYYTNFVKTSVGTAAHLAAPASAVHQTLAVMKGGTGSGSVKSAPDGIDCGSTCSAEFTKGASVTLTATPDTGSSFDSWSGGGCGGSGTCEVRMDSDLTVSAAFSVKSHTLSASIQGDGTISGTGLTCGGTSCSGTYTYNTKVTLTATPRSGASFISWTGCDEVNGTYCSVTMTANKNVTASFTVNPCSYTISPAGKSFTHKKGSVNIRVTAKGAKSCSRPDVVRSDTWFEANLVSFSKNRGTVKIAAPANTTTSPRSGTLSIGDKTFQVTQAGVPCTISIYPKSAVPDSSSSTGSFSVTSLPGCPWTASVTTDDPWLTVVSGTPGDGNGTVAWQVMENLTKKNRAGTIRMFLTPKKSRAFTVRQKK